MKEILEILNPVRLLTCDDWMRIAGIVNANRAWTFANSCEVRAIQLQSRFEKLVRGKMEYKTAGDMARSNTSQMVWQPALLKKERFICEVEKPIIDNPDLVTPGQESKIKTYTEAQSKVWFEGFDCARYDSKLFHTSGMELWAGRYIPSEIWVGDTPVSKKIETVFDFLYELERYNRTAKEPIKIMWTEAFLTQLLND